MNAPTRSKSHLPNHSHFVGFLLLSPGSGRARSLPLLTGHEGTARAHQVAVRSSCRCRSSQRRESGQIAQRAGRRKKMPTASARAQNEAEGVHGDGAKSQTRHQKLIRCLAELDPLGERRADSGPRRALIAWRPKELHEADPGHGPRRREKPQGRRASGCRARRRRQGRRSWPELGRDPGQSTKLGRGGRRRGGAVAGVLSRGWASLGRLVLRQEYSPAGGWC